MKKTVIISFEIEGFHNYPGAPQKVSFLENNHRHSFQVKVGFGVEDSNREKEIFIMRDEVKFMLNEFYGSPCEFGAMSCEMIAEVILDHFKHDNAIWVEVWEENTGGAKVEL